MTRARAGASGARSRMHLWGDAPSGGHRCAGAGVRGKTTAAAPSSPAIDSHPSTSPKNSAYGVLTPRTGTATVRVCSVPAGSARYQLASCPRTRPWWSTASEVPCRVVRTRLIPFSTARSTTCCPSASVTGSQSLEGTSRMSAPARPAWRTSPGKLASKQITVASRPYGVSTVGTTSPWPGCMPHGDGPAVLGMVGELAEPAAQLVGESARQGAADLHPVTQPHVGPSSPEHRVDHVLRQLRVPRVTAQRDAGPEPTGPRVRSLSRTFSAEGWSSST